MAKRRKQFLYHVTHQELQTLTVRRQVPVIADKREPATPRLCVCPAVPNCVAAANLVNSRRPIHVYRTPKPLKGINPRNVWDQTITSERWLIPPMRLDHFATIDQDEAVSILEPVYWYIKITANNVGVKGRIAAQLLAWEVLGDRFPNRWQLKKTRMLAEHFGIDDGEKYFSKATSEAFDTLSRARISRSSFLPHVALNRAFCAF